MPTLARADAGYATVVFEPVELAELVATPLHGCDLSPRPSIRLSTFIPAAGHGSTETVPAFAG
jgi:hypothetical protein